MGPRKDLTQKKDLGSAVLGRLKLATNAPNDDIVEAGAGGAGKWEPGLVPAGVKGPAQFPTFKQGHGFAVEPDLKGVGVRL